MSWCRVKAGTNRLNSIENGSWLRVRRILLRSLMMAHSITMNRVYTMNMVVPRDSPVMPLMTFGSETMGDAPMDAFTVSTTPNDITRTDATISTRSFLKVGLAITGVYLSGAPILSMNPSPIQYITGT